MRIPVSASRRMNLAPVTRSEPMSSLQAPAGLQPSASYCFTMRIELRQLPGAFAAWRSAIGARARSSARSTSCASSGDGVVRDVTVACGDAEHAEASSARSARSRA